MLLAKSLAGHDKGKLYYVISSDESFVCLVNGKTRTLGKPKKKKIKHVQLIKRLQRDLEISDEDIKEDSDVRKLLKTYNRIMEEE